MTSTDLLTKQLPRSYNIIITAQVPDGPQLTVRFDDLPRDTIMAPDYGNAGLVSVVKALEYYVYDHGKNPDAKAPDA